MSNLKLFLASAGMLLLVAVPGMADNTDQAAAPAGGDKAKEGAEIFGSNGCGWCHENGGKSAGKGPQLMGTSRTDSFITFRIKHGKEAKMPAFGAALTDAQIADVIAYIRSLKQ